MKARSKKLAKIVTFDQFRNFLGSSVVARRFAEKHDLVYFGSVGRNDDSKLVKGITTSNTYKDTHYLVGTDYGRDVIFLQRSDVVRSAYSKKAENYTWNILAIDLLVPQPLPHVFIEGRGRYGPGFREAVSIKTGQQINELPSYFLDGYDPLFGEKFTVHLSASTAAELYNLIPPERAAVMAHHFSSFDYELLGDELYVYYLSSRPMLGQLENMFKAGVWLADELDPPAAASENEEDDE